MFERFTPRSREVLVLAQEEARLFQHGFVGTEHLLLGLVNQGEGVAAKALELQGVTLDAVRDKVAEMVGPVTSGAVGSPPFTPNAKRVLERALREALQLGHNYIGTEHLLLGVLHEGQCAGARALVQLGAEPGLIREQVRLLLS